MHFLGNQWFWDTPSVGNERIGKWLNNVRKLSRVMDFCFEMMKQYEQRLSETAATGMVFGVSETPFQRLLGALVTKHIQEGTE